MLVLQGNEQALWDWERKLNGIISGTKYNIVSIGNRKNKA
jgi:hypothetical protein